MSTTINPTQIYTTFVSEKVRTVKDADGNSDLTVQLNINEVYPMFKHWFRTNYSIEQMMHDRIQVMNELTKILGPRAGRGYWASFELYDNKEE